MKVTLFVSTAVLLAMAVPAFAQESATPSDRPPQAAASATAPETSRAKESNNPFKVFAADFKGFFSKDTGQVMSMFTVGSIAAVPWDRENARNFFHNSEKALDEGNTLGGFGVQAAFSIGTYAFGSLTHNAKAKVLGRDLLRAQVLSQVLVQSVKVIVYRERPDGSDHYSFPSGHSASAFAAAAVLQRHFGWKVGVPAYAFGGYVASARMSSNKHYLSDVVMGAGFGLASGRTVTMHLKGSQFGLGVAPTTGGAQMTITKQY